MVLERQQILSIEATRLDEVLINFKENDDFPSEVEWVNVNDLEEDIIDIYEPKNEMDEICPILSSVVDWITNPWTSDDTNE